MKRIYIIYVVLALLFLLDFCCYAMDPTTQTEISDAYEKSDEILESFSIPSLLGSALDALKSAFRGCAESFLALLLLTLAVGLIGAFTDKRAVICSCELVLCALSFPLISGVLSSVEEYINGLQNFMLSMLPVMTSLYTASSAPVTAAYSCTSSTIILNMCSSVFSAVLIPSVKCLTVFSVITLISRSFDFGGFSKLLKKLIAWGFGFVCCVMSACVYFQSVIGAARDSLASRAVRYAAASVIPVIGGTLSESARTLSESIRLVRSVTGIAGILTIIGTVITPIAVTVVCKLMLSACSAVAGLTGTSGIAAYFEELCSALDVLLGACIGVMIVFVIILGIFAKTVINI